MFNSLISGVNSGTMEAYHDYFDWYWIQDRWYDFTIYYRIQL